MTKNKKIVIGSVILLVITGGLYFAHEKILQYIFAPRATTAQLGTSLSEPLQTQDLSSSETVATATDAAVPSTPQLIAEQLSIPWEVQELPDRSVLVTERPGTLLHLSQSGQKRTAVSGVEHIGEGGLLGMALDPDFESNNWVYLYLTTENATGLQNRIERYTLDIAENALSEQTVILEGIPGAKYHDGGRIAFGPDGYLYAATGDAQTESLAQDTGSLAGKILRMTADGQPAPDNPFGNYTYSYGHRNPQGLAWDDQGRLWSSEHGPSGTQSGYDEVNVIVSGGNYGWPNVKGDETAEGMIAPIIHSGSADTWAPGDIAVIDDTVYFTGLRGEALYTAQITETNGSVSLENFTAHLRTDIGRIRTVQVGKRGQLYLTTSNTDGRGSADEQDDLLIVLSPTYLQ